MREQTANDVVEHRRILRASTIRNDIIERQEDAPTQVYGNPLFPIFLKPERVHTLIVGGGSVASEKVRALLDNCPGIELTIVALTVSSSIREMQRYHPNIVTRERPYDGVDLYGHSIVIIAVGDIALSRRITLEARAKGMLVNAADKPDQCDFYLGSIVSKGYLKIAISTNGKSPTIAKRLRELLSESLPDDINLSIERLHTLRSRLGGDFHSRVRKLNKATAALVENKSPGAFATRNRTALRYAYYISVLLAAWFILAGTDHGIDERTILFAVAGFFAQLVDGALGMAYGLSATTILLSCGVAPAMASVSVHASELFTTCASGALHYRQGNVDRSLVRSLVVPGVIGSIAGAALLGLSSGLGQWLVLIIGVYTLALSISIIIKGMRGIHAGATMTRIGPLALIGGFLDSFGGGGWGTIVSGTLIARGRDPRFTIGSANLAEFFVTVSSFATLTLIFGFDHWQANIGLIVGGLIAAPIAANVARKIPIRYMLLGVGILIAIISIKNIISALNSYLN